MSFEKTEHKWELRNNNFINFEFFFIYMELTIVLEPQKEGGFTVHVPSLPGCISEGETKDEAIANIKEAIELYLEPDTNEMTEFTGETIKLTV